MTGRRRERFVVLGLFFLAPLGFAEGVPLNRDLVLSLNETVQLVDGAFVTFESLSVEEIAASPDDPQAYPAGSGVNVSLGVRWGNSAKETVLLSALSAGYASTGSVVWQERRFVLVKTESEHSKPKIHLRVTRVVSGESVYLRANAIFGVELVKVPPPSAQPASGLSRIEATLVLKQVFKGQVTQEPGSTHRLELPVYDGAIRSLPAEAVGALWLNQRPEPGSKWIAFSFLPSPVDVVAALTNHQRSTLVLYPWSHVENDLAFIARLRGYAQCSEMISALSPSTGTRHVAAGFFWQTCANDVLAERRLFTALLKKLSEPAMAREFVEALWTNVSDELSLHQGLPSYAREREHEFLRFTLAHLQRLPGDADFFRNLIGTFIPNWLGIGSGMTKVAVGDVLKTAAERAAFVKFLDLHPKVDGVTALRQWAVR